MFNEVKGVDAVALLLFGSSKLSQDEKNALLKVFLESAGDAQEVKENG